MVLVTENEYILSINTKKSFDFFVIIISESRDFQTIRIISVCLKSAFPFPRDKTVTAKGTLVRITATKADTGANKKENK